MLEVACFAFANLLQRGVEYHTAMKIDQVRPPARFVGLHCHSGFSTFDGLGYPEDHIKFVTSEAQGMDAWALTDHGNGNGLAHAHSAAKKIQKKGQKYRQLYGVEFYFVPSLKQWAIDYDAHKQSIKDAKSSAEMEKRAKTPTDVDADPGEEDEQGGHVVEDENETKSVDVSSKDWQRRYHLVAVAKNQNGLGNLFRLVKASYKHGFYRYPRIDFELLKLYGQDIIWSTACLGGIYSGKILLGEAQNKSHDEIMNDLQNLTDRFTGAVGEKNFFLELQFNKLEKQHTVNRYLIDLSKKTGIPLITTADSHYPDPSKWQARELYKKLGWMGAKLDGAALPKFEDLKCELYPKNATQMWDEYKKSHENYEFYQGTEELVRDAIERTHDLVWNECEDAWVDTKAKLPQLDTPEKTAFDQLVDLVKEGLQREGMVDKPEYVERAKMELSDIKYLGHASYFVTMYKIFKKAEQRTLLGPGRGSGGGSLVNFLLGITQIDPIPYGLLWSRFLGRHRCLQKDSLVLTENGVKPIKDLDLGEKVLTHGGTYEPVIDKEDDVGHDINAVIKTSRENFSCSPNHRWLVRRDGEVKEVMTTDLVKGDKLLFVKKKSPRRDTYPSES